MQTQATNDDNHVFGLETISVVWAALDWNPQVALQRIGGGDDAQKWPRTHLRRHFRDVDGVASLEHQGPWRHAQREDEHQRMAGDRLQTRHRWRMFKMVGDTGSRHGRRAT